jgi:hypothetical protein
MFQFDVILEAHALFKQEFCSRIVLKINSTMAMRCTPKYCRRSVKLEWVVISFSNFALEAIFVNYGMEPTDVLALEVELAVNRTAA